VRGRRVGPTLEFVLLGRLARGAFALVLLFVAGSAVPTSGAPLHLQVSPDDTVRAVQAVVPRVRDLSELALLYSGLEAPSVVNADPPDYQPGRVDTFWIARQRPAEHFQSEAVLRYVGRHAYWYVERGFDVADDAVRMADDVFATRIYPRVRQLVGSEPFPGIDNDPRITIFSGNVPDVAGYVTSSDSYPRAVHPYSNERDMVYLNLRALQMGNAEYLATLAHEFTHLVHWNTHPNEDTWVKEGLGDLAITLVFPDRRLASSGFASVPDLQLNSWSDGEPGSEPLGPHYQEASWFLRYFLDRFGEEALYPLLARETPGPASVEAFMAASSGSFADLFSDWVVANVVGSSPGRSVSPYAGARPDPPRVLPLDPSQALAASVAQFGVDYYELPTTPGTNLQFVGETTIPLVGTSPFAGEAMWYGGRADSSVSSMTRRLDLTGVQSATLSYDTWFDIEQDYDFAYVSASRDGAHWTLLAAPGMMRLNPTGNNLGVGYTGRSGGGARPDWISESTDLTAYTGGPVWLRFSYVTDDAILHEGIVIDDIRVAALGLVDGAESSTTDWDLQGWARVGGALPQTWSLQVIEWSQGVADVRKLPVDASGRATWSPRGTLDRAVLAVAGTAPVTLQRAQYNLDITP
jgi:immune inhibitor A